MKKIISLSTAFAFCILVLSSFNKDKHCVFRAVMNEDPVPRYPVHNDMTNINSSVKDGLSWLKEAQQLDGGWGCGQHSRQDVRDPHAVSTDPATTAMVAMAIMRSGSTLDEGEYHKELNDATLYLINKVNQAKNKNSNFEGHGQTQIQSKLGQNIDIVMTTQYFTNALEELDKNHEMYDKIKSALELCVNGIQDNIAANGSLKGGTWAGVLQSSFANSALESAQAIDGVNVDKDKLEASRKYQRTNYNPTTEEVSTADGAGVMLYAVSGSTRASAKEAKRARKVIEKAKKEGRLEEKDVMNTANLIKSGVSEAEAMELNASYQVYNSAKVKAQRKEVMTGYGNNGGEEFLSFLQTGESLVLNEDEDWTNWYDNITKTIMGIQNQDGSWNGHHCITSPVFCTATCVSLLTINNDIERIKNRETREKVER